MVSLLHPKQVTFRAARFDYRLELAEGGLSSAVRMTDAEGRAISYEIVETAGPPELSALLAPVGSLSEEPEYFPIFIEVEGHCPDLGEVPIRRVRREPFWRYVAGLLQMRQKLGKRILVHAAQSTRAAVKYRRPPRPPTVHARPPQTGPYER